MICLWYASCANKGTGLCSICWRTDGHDGYKPVNGDRCPVCSGLLGEGQLICIDCQTDYVMFERDKRSVVVR